MFFDKSWEPAVSVIVPLSVTVSVSATVFVSVDPWDMLNNFCFHVYAQMLLFMGKNDSAFLDHAHTLSC